MEQHKLKKKNMSLHLRSKSIVMNQHVQQDNSLRSKSVVRTSSRTLPTDCFSSLRKQELLKTYDLKQVDIPIRSPLHSRFPSLRCSRNQISSNSRSQNSQQDTEESPLEKPYRKSKRRVDYDRTYLLDDIIVDFLYLNSDKNIKTQVQQPNKTPAKYMRSLKLPSINSNRVTNVKSVRSSGELQYSIRPLQIKS